MDKKDLNILGKKISTTASKKDLAVVTGFNSYVQKIENVCKIQKNEIPSEMSLGVDYFIFIFNPRANRYLMQIDIEKSISAAIPELDEVNAEIVYYDTEKITFDVSFVLNKQLKKQNSKCRIEVELT
jgi:hypothetical protein